MCWLLEPGVTMATRASCSGGTQQREASSLVRCETKYQLLRNPPDMSAVSKERRAVGGGGAVLSQDGESQDF